MKTEQIVALLLKLQDMADMATRLAVVCSGVAEMNHLNRLRDAASAALKARDLILMARVDAGRGCDAETLAR